MREKNDTARELIDFIDRSPVGYFAIDIMARELEAAGFRRLCEHKRWELARGGAYYMVKDDAALIAFRVPEGDLRGMMIAASHADSPTFRVKPNAEITVANRYVKLNVEKYGGAIISSWLDRPLSVAGRIVVREDEGVDVRLSTRLVNIDRDLLVIPNLAIHLDRKLNEGYTYDLQKDMLPLYAGVSDPGEAEGLLRIQLAEAAGVRAEDIADYDLYLYNRTPAVIFGAHSEFIASGRLDDLQCAFAAHKAMLEVSDPQSLAVNAIFYNEEVGSSTKQGAGSPLLQNVLRRVYAALGYDEEDYLAALSESFMLSADNAQGLHPNHEDRSDPTNRPVLNGGVVIKYNADQKYTTDALSGAIVRELCKRADVPVQIYVNRSDIAGGSTLGHISNTQVPLLTADIGLAQLAMHSAYETAGAYDTDYMLGTIRTLFESALVRETDDTLRVVL